jgi:hypothetical protein
MGTGRARMNIIQYNLLCTILSLEAECEVARELQNLGGTRVRNYVKCEIIGLKGILLCCSVVSVEDEDAIFATIQWASHALRLLYFALLGSIEKVRRCSRPQM